VIDALNGDDLLEKLARGMVPDPADRRQYAED